MRTKNMTKIALALLLMTLSASCTLRKRNKAKDEEKDKSKIQVDLPNGQKVPLRDLMQKAPGSTDPQAHLDFEEFQNPQRETSLSARPTEILLRKRLTGATEAVGSENGENKNSLAYTDLAEDATIAAMRIEHNERKETTETKVRALAFAKSIRGLTVLDRRGSIFSIELQQETTDKKVVTTTLSGPSIDEGRKATLEEKNSSDANKKLTGKLDCLDVDFKSACSNYHLRLTSEENKEKLIADILIRISEPEVRVLPSTLEPQTASTQQLLDVFLKTEEGRYFSNVEMQSFTVINGISQFYLRLETNKKEFINLGGSLLTGLGHQPIQVPLTKNPKAIFNNHSPLAPVANDPKDLSVLFESATLTKNNGRGTLQIILTNIVKNESSTVHSTSQPESFTITVNPTVVPVRPTEVPEKPQ